MADTTISFPYTLLPNGKVYTTTDSSKIFLDRVLTLLSTSVGQRPINTNYGVDWSNALFESDSTAEDAIRLGITKAIGTWLPSISIDSINTVFNSGSGLESVQLMLILPDNTVASLAINPVLLNYDGTITR